MANVGGRLVSMNPRTGTPLGEVELMTPEQVAAEVQSAQEAFPRWAALPIAERKAMLYRVRDFVLAHADEIAQVVHDEQGKPFAEVMSADILPVVEICNYYAPRLGSLLKDEPIPMHIFKGIKSSRLVPKPLGVVAVITPWNFPFSIPMSGILFALMTGNTVVFKPASEVPFIGKMIARCILEGGGVPSDVFHLVLASGRSVGNTLCRPPIRKVVFTGSTEVGKFIQKQCAEYLIPTVQELGGKDPMIVLEDADLEMTVKGALWGAFANCGQICASVERCYVMRPLYDEFVKRVVEEASKLRLGVPPLDDYDIGPLVNESQRAVVEAHVADAVAKGAKILLGGKRPEGASGFFFEPTIMVNVNHDMLAMRDETFGPLLPIMPVDSEEEAIRLANDSPYGLTASVWSRNRARAEKVALQLDAGTVTVNDHAYSYALVETPWQGMKESGLGASHSILGVREFYFPQHINVDLMPRLRRRMWWYPYGPQPFALMKELIGALSRSAGLPGFAAKLLTRPEWRKILLG